MTTLGPASKKQEAFLNSNAPLDGSEGAFITLFGGAAGSGKSYLGIMAALKYVHDPKYRGCITRLNSTMLKGSGGVFDTAIAMYSQVDPKIKVNTKDMKIRFSNGAQIEFKHYDHEKNWIDWQGLQLSTCLIDEASQYTSARIEYIISRLRTDADMEAHLLMTANPDYDSVLRIWLEKGGYLDEEGYPIPEMDGVITYTGQVDGERQFTKTREEWIEKYPSVPPKTFRFLPATIYDNPPLMESEPGYITTLENLPRVEKARLLHGNWYAKAQGTSYFLREWVNFISSYEIPSGCTYVRAWDLAGSLPSEKDASPDYTAGVKIAKDSKGHLYIVDVVRFRDRAAGVMEKIIATAESDGQDCKIILPKDPGASGKYAFDSQAAELFSRGFVVRSARPERSKLKRFEPFCAMAENGSVSIVRADWNDIYIDELERFTGERSTRTLKDD